jgi:hypothetical protein
MWWRGSFKELSVEFGVGTRTKIGLFFLLRIAPIPGQKKPENKGRTFTLAIASSALPSWKRALSAVSG